jgi:hypothetical protein
MRLKQQNQEVDLSAESEKRKPEQDDSADLSLDDDLNAVGAGIGNKMGAMQNEN